MRNHLEDSPQETTPHVNTNSTSDIDNQQTALPSSRSVNHSEDTIVITSCVGGGPMQRLAHRLTELEFDAEVHADDSPDSWRASLRSGRLGHLRTRARSYLKHPITSLIRASKPSTRLAIPTTNPFFMPFFMVAGRAIHGKPVIALVYDLYPDALEIAGMDTTGLIGRIMAAANRYTFENADAVVFIGTRTAAHARERYGEPKNWTVIETGADAEELSPQRNAGAPQSELEQWCSERTVFSYIGNMGMSHDWETLRDAVPRLVNQQPKGSQVGFLVASLGPRVDALKEAWRDLPEDTIRFVTPLSDDEWSRILCQSDVSLVTLTHAARMTCIPSKALSALCAGSALLIIAPANSDVASLADMNVGEQVEPGDVDALVLAMRKMLDDPDHLEKMRLRARNTAEEHFDIRKLASRWRALIEDIETKPTNRRGYDTAKRALDIVVSSAGIALTSPLWIPTALAIGATMGRPILFRQKRPGKDGDIFELAKFRTMRNPKANETGPGHDGARITRLGQVLRSTSIDELPTLWNVLKGDMSLVGPRPLLVRYLDRYTEQQARRHEVSPGVTGWAQVNGRNAISWEEKFERDVWYVDHQSLALDVLILLKTIGKVVRRADISQTEHATMPEFMGSAESKT